MLRDTIKNKVFIIAEAGVNHNGRLDLAKRLIEVAKIAGVDAVKFQTWKTENLIVRGTKTAEYQQNNTGESDQFAMIKKIELSYDDFVELKNYSNQLGIIFFSTPDEEESLNFLVNKLGVPFIKIGSGEVTNLLYLKKIAAKRKPVILSTGMSNMADVVEAVRIIEEGGVGSASLAVLHCSSNYPCPFEDVNLGVLKTYQRIFPNNIIGYSDHTEGVLVPPLAVALGAKIVEKHFTLDNNMEGPDHIASLNPDDLRLMVESIRKVEENKDYREAILNHPEAKKIIGSSEKFINFSEEKIKPVVQKTIVAKNDLPVGTVISESDITSKRTSEIGLFASQFEKVLGRSLKKNIQKDQAIIMDFLK